MVRVLAASMPVLDRLGSVGLMFYIYVLGVSISLPLVNVAKLYPSLPGLSVTNAIAGFSVRSFIVSCLFLCTIPSHRIHPLRGYTRKPYLVMTIAVVSFIISSTQSSNCLPLHIMQSRAPAHLPTTRRLRLIQLDLPFLLAPYISTP